MDFPVPVIREVSYPLKTNRKGNAIMKDMIVNALKEAGIEIDGLDDEALFAKYNELLATNADNGDEGGDEGDNGNEDDTDLAAIVASAVSSAVKPLNDKIDGLEGKLNQSSDEEKDQMIEVVVSSGKYPGMTKEILAKLPIEDIKPMAANCKTGHGIRPNGADDQGGDGEFKPLKLVGEEE